MEKEELINKTIHFVKKNILDHDPGHNWWHVFRVWKMSVYLSENYKTNNVVVELSALLHDTFDKKFNDSEALKKGNSIINKFLTELRLADEDINHIQFIIGNISYRNLSVPDKTSIEFKIVQDADRLDAMGAIGIARAFSYGGFKNREIYNPEIQLLTCITRQEYINNQRPTINHFYEKLLKLKDLMNTEEARRIAEERHDFMNLYLDNFFLEWDVNKKTQDEDR